MRNSYAWVFSYNIITNVQNGIVLPGGQAHPPGRGGLGGFILRSWRPRPAALRLPAYFVQDAPGVYAGDTQRCHPQSRPHFSEPSAAPKTSCRILAQKKNWGQI